MNDSTNNHGSTGTTQQDARGRLEGAPLGVRCVTPRGWTARLGPRPDDVDAFEACADADDPHRAPACTVEVHWHDLADPAEADHAPAAECGQESLASCVLRVVDLLHSFATTHDVRLRAEIDASARCTPAGPLATVLFSALRHAIEAASGPAAANPIEGHEVSVCVRADGHSAFVHVMDNSADAQSADSVMLGHSMGLCRGIVERLGGALSMRQVPFGPGALISVSVPAENLRRAG